MVSATTRVTASVTSRSTVFELVVGVQGGWFYSGDFYAQRYHEVDEKNEEVNASSLSALVW